MTVAAPAASKLRPCPRRGSPFTNRGTKMSVSRPIGTLIQNTHSQPAYSVSTPPSSTPMAAPAPAIAPRMPSALLRSAPSWNVTIVIEKTDGARTAERRPLEQAEDDEHRVGWASAQQAEKTAKRASPTMNSRRRPSTSPGAPAEQQEAAEGEAVAADHPLEILGREARGPLDRRQRDVHDRDVEHHHQVGDAEHRECEPAPRVGSWRCWTCPWADPFARLAARYAAARTAPSPRDVAWDGPHRVG